MILWIHPIIQTIATALAFYVMFMGVQRFRCNHFGSKACFLWKRHVALGKTVHMLWLIGFFFGVLAAQTQWSMLTLTGPHFYVGLAMMPLLVVGLITGVMLQKPAKRTQTVPLIHGISNAVLFLLALYQVYSGVQSTLLFLLPE